MRYFRGGRPKHNHCPEQPCRASPRRNRLLNMVSPEGQEGWWPTTSLGREAPFTWQMHSTHLKPCGRRDPHAFCTAWLESPSPQQEDGVCFEFSCPHIAWTHAVHSALLPHPSLGIPLFTLQPGHHTVGTTWRASPKGVALSSLPPIAFSWGGLGIPGVLPMEMTSPLPRLGSAAGSCTPPPRPRGARAARLTPDQKAVCSNHTGVSLGVPLATLCIAPAFLGGCPA